MWESLLNLVSGNTQLLRKRPYFSTNCFVSATCQNAKDGIQ